MFDFRFFCQSTTDNQVAFKHTDNNSAVPHSSADFLSLKVRNVQSYKAKQSLNMGINVLYSEITILIWHTCRKLHLNSPVTLIKTWSCKTYGQDFFISPFPITTSKLYFRNTCEFLLHQGCSDKVAMLWFLLNAKMWHFIYSSLTQ